jgi:hypothetical protein
VIAFAWHWSDANSLTDANGSLTAWGRIFQTQYLDRVRSTQ